MSKGRKLPRPRPNQIRELRENKGWSQEVLAEKVGTSVQQISRLEVGDRQLTEGWMRKIAGALGVQPADLLAQEPDALQHSISRLSVAQQRLLGDVVRSVLRFAEAAKFASDLACVSLSNGSLRVRRGGFLLATRKPRRVGLAAGPGWPG